MWQVEYNLLLGLCLCRYPENGVKSSICDPNAENGVMQKMGSSLRFVIPINGVKCSICDSTVVASGFFSEKSKVLSS